MPNEPSLVHVLSPKFLSMRARPLGKTENRSGRLILFLVIGAIFWVFVFGLLYRLLKYFRGIPEIGALLAAKLLGLMFVSLFGILILSNVVTAPSSFFLSKDLDLLVAAPLDSPCWPLLEWCWCFASSGPSGWPAPKDSARWWSSSRCCEPRHPRGCRASGQRRE